MSEKNTRSWWQRNYKLRTVKAETEKISMNNTTELNQLIYVGAKLVCEIGVLQRNSKPGWKIQLDTQIRNFRQQAKMKGNAGICWDEKKIATTQINQTILHKEINQTVLRKEGRLKRYQDRLNNSDKSGHSIKRKNIQPAFRGRMNEDIPITG